MTERWKILLRYFLLATLLGLLFRAPSSFRDGLSERALEVGWWAWHLWGWLARDIPQAIFIFAASVRACSRAGVIGKPGMAYVGGVLVINAALSFWLHEWLYALAVTNRWRFGW